MFVMQHTRHGRSGKNKYIAFLDTENEKVYYRI